MNDTSVDQLQNSRNVYRIWFYVSSALLLVTLGILALFILLELLWYTTNQDYIGTFFNFISYATNFLSFLLAIIAIWISFQYNSISESLNGRTQALVYEIKAQSTLISLSVVPELSKYGESARTALESLTETVRAIVISKTPSS